MDELVVLKDDLWLSRQKVAGRAVSNCLREFASMMKNYERLNLLEIERMCESQLKIMDCTPTFFNYIPKGGKHSFPAKVCLSVNNAVVHGVPYDYEIKEGDVVTLDFGATYEGAIADAAFTTCFRRSINEKTTEMLVSCQQALNAGVEQVKVGNKLGCIGFAIHNYVKNLPFGLITTYGGHGINYNKPHAHPFVENKSRKDDGVYIMPGLSIAIEPMLTMTKNVSTKTLNDNWTIVTNGLSCHFEHSATVDMKGNTHTITSHGMIVKDYIA